MPKQIKKVTKRIGRAFGFSEVNDSFIEQRNQLEEIRRHNDVLLGEVENLKQRAEWFEAENRLFSRYYYYNEFAKNAHPALFEKYRGCNKGKDLVIVACGPSVNLYKPISGAKHLAVNRAFLRDDIKFDYLFMHDNMMLLDCGEKIKKYKAEKFMAFATNETNARSFNVLSDDVCMHGAKRFFISDPAIPSIGGGQFDVIQPDITKGMLYDRGGGTVFSALQFALFTKPRTIYIVGCDCTSDGYFKEIDQSKKQNLLEATEYLWREAKTAIAQYYPEVKIVSVNPVKLKGLFEDLYQ